METNEANEVQAVYTYGQGLISMKRNSGISEICGFYHYDGLGTVKQLTDNSGSVVANYTYDGFGNMIAETGSTENSYKFTGERFDDSSGLLYLRARYYAPSIGRFISKDPILEPMMGLNGHIWLLDTVLILQPRNFHPYVYVANRPVNLLDADGLAPQQPGCDVINRIIPPIDRNRCFRACCDWHDDCYARNKCGWGSWLCIGSEACGNCNNEVVQCFVGCAISPGLW